MSSLEAVLFDWRGTLSVTMTDETWVDEALAKLGQANNETPYIVEALAYAYEAPEIRAAWPHVDCNAEFHRRTYFELFKIAGLSDELASTLYDIETDAGYNPFGDDVEETLREFKKFGVKIAVVSDIHFDIRPAFEDAGLLSLIDCFVLSYEHGFQKPNPKIFGIALEEIGVYAHQALMVGDRAGYDGGAVGLGVLTLLIPPLRAKSVRRLHRVLSLVLNEQS